MAPTTISEGAITPTGSTAARLSRGRGTGHVHAASESYWTDLAAAASSRLTASLSPPPLRWLAVAV